LGGLYAIRRYRKKLEKEKEWEKVQKKYRHK
jgi:positive regulator of sigma E activity